MLFTIMFGQPYLTGGGKAYPVDIDGENVTWYEEGSVDFPDAGEFSLDEIRAKFGPKVTHKAEKPEKKPRKRKEE